MVGKPWWLRTLNVRGMFALGAFAAVVGTAFLVAGLLWATPLLGAALVWLVPAFAYLASALRRRQSDAGPGSQGRPGPPPSSR